jgi:hypothetical protein
MELGEHTFWIRYAILQRYSSCATFIKRRLFSLEWFVKRNNVPPASRRNIAMRVRWMLEPL